MEIGRACGDRQARAEPSELFGLARTYNIMIDDTKARTCARTKAKVRGRGGICSE